MVAPLNLHPTRCKKIKTYSSVKNNIYALYTYDLQHDKDIFMAASPIGYSLQFASPALRSDKEFILSLVKKNGMALEFASFTLIARSFMLR